MGSDSGQRQPRSRLSLKWLTSRRRPRSCDSETSTIRRSRQTWDWLLRAPAEVTAGKTVSDLAWLHPVNIRTLKSAFEAYLANLSAVVDGLGRAGVCFSESTAQFVRRVNMAYSKLDHCPVLLDVITWHDNATSQVERLRKHGISFDDYAPTRDAWETVLDEVQRQNDSLSSFFAGHVRVDHPGASLSLITARQEWYANIFPSQRPLAEKTEFLIQLLLELRLNSLDSTTLLPLEIDFIPYTTTAVGGTTECQCTASALSDPTVIGRAAPTFSERSRTPCETTRQSPSGAATSPTTAGHITAATGKVFELEGDESVNIVSAPPGYSRKDRSRIIDVTFNHALSILYCLQPFVQDSQARRLEKIGFCLKTWASGLFEEECPIDWLCSGVELSNMLLHRAVLGCLVDIIIYEERLILYLLEDFQNDEAVTKRLKRLHVDALATLGSEKVVGIALDRCEPQADICITNTEWESVMLDFIDRAVVDLFESLPAIRAIRREWVLKQEEAQAQNAAAKSAALEAESRIYNTAAQAQALAPQTGEIQAGTTQHVFNPAASVRKFVFSNKFSVATSSSNEQPIPGSGSLYPATSTRLFEVDGSSPVSRIKDSEAEPKTDSATSVEERNYSRMPATKVPVGPFSLTTVTSTSSKRHSKEAAPAYTDIKNDKLLSSITNVWDGTHESL